MTCRNEYNYPVKARNLDRLERAKAVESPNVMKSIYARKGF